MKRKSLDQKIIKLKNIIQRKQKEYPFKYLYEPYAKQEIFHRIDCKVGMFVGGNGTGKTMAGCQEVCMEAFSYNPFRHVRKKRHKLIWVAGDTMSTIEEIILPKMRELLPPESMGLWKYIPRPGGTYRPTIKCYNRKGKEIAKILLKSYEQGRKGFQGAEPELILLDEEPPEAIWKEIYARTRKGGKIRITATPFGYGLIAALQEKIEEEEETEEYQIPYEYVQAHIDDNIYITPEERKAMIREFGDEINRIDGSIYIPEGMIYKTHINNLLVDSFDRQSFSYKENSSNTWELWTAVDLGGTDEFCALTGLYNPYIDVLVICDEYYAAGADVDIHTKHIFEQESRYVQHCSNAHRINRRFDNNNKVAVREFRKNGLKGSEVVKGPGSIDAGIREVRERARTGGLYIIKRNCPNTIKQWKVYRYSKRGDGVPASGQKDHAMDTLRYICHAVAPKVIKKKVLPKSRRMKRSLGQNYLGRYA